MIFRLEAQNVYFKTVDIDKANDSITALVDSISDISIRFSQNSYWASRTDTTAKPNLRNFYLYLYKDSTDNSYAIIVNRYFLFGPYETELQALDFFKLHQNELLNTEMRPDERDLVVDTSFFTRTNTPLNDTTKWLAAYYPHRASTRDGLRKFVVLNKAGKSIEINYNRNHLDPDDYYYQYNSSKPFYTLTLLLENDWERVQGAIDWDVELAQQGVLNEEGKIKWMLDWLPKRQKELKEIEKYWKEELKKIQSADN